MAVSLISVPITDVGGRRWTINYFLQGTNTIAAITDRMDEILPELDNVTGGVIGVPTVQLPLATTFTGKATATAGSVGYEGLNFVFGVNGSTYSYTQRVPAVLPAFLPAYGSPETANTALEDYATLMVTPGVGLPSFTDEYENTLASFQGVNPSRRKAT